MLGVAPEKVLDLAGSGELAVALLDKEYDLIVTDLIMEGLDGMEAVRQTKSKRSDQAVFILTGYDELDSASEELRLG